MIFAFKQLFGTNGSEDILIAFLNAMLQESLESPIASLQLEDPHLHREYEEDKLSILDVSATLDTGTKVNVEIQLNNNHDMVKRSLYYWGRLYTSQLQKGCPTVQCTSQNHHHKLTKLRNAFGTPNLPYNEHIMEYTTTKTPE